jgi:hypothetical protein
LAVLVHFKVATTMLHYKKCKIMPLSVCHCRIQIWDKGGNNTFTFCSKKGKNFLSLKEPMQSGSYLLNFEKKYVILASYLRIILFSAISLQKCLCMCLFSLKVTKNGIWKDLMPSIRSPPEGPKYGKRNLLLILWAVSSSQELPALPSPSPHVSTPAKGFYSYQIKN